MEIIDKSSSTINTSYFIKAIIKKTLAEGGSFAFWRKPQSNEKVLFVCNQGVTEHDELNLEESEPGFVFAPFRPDGKKIFLRADLVFKFQGEEIIEGAELFNASFHSIENDDQKKKHVPYHLHRNTPGDVLPFTAIVTQAIAEIEMGSLEKVVPSRFKEIKVSENFDPLKAFESLCDKHPNALVTFL